MKFSQQQFEEVVFNSNTFLKDLNLKVEISRWDLYRATLVDEYDFPAVTIYYKEEPDSLYVTGDCYITVEIESFTGRILDYQLVIEQTVRFLLKFAEEE